MSKTMNDSSPQAGVAGFLATFFMGIWLEYLNILPPDLLWKLLTLFLTGGATALGALVVRRVAFNILKKIEEKKLLPGIFKDNEKQK